jgi:hypothetical protein
METSAIILTAAAWLATNALTYWSGVRQAQKKAINAAVVQERARRIAQAFDEQKVTLNELLVLVGTIGETARATVAYAEKGWMREHYECLRRANDHEKDLRNLVIHRRASLPNAVHDAAQRVRGELDELRSLAPTSQENELPDYAAFNGEYMDKLRGSFAAIDHEATHLANAMHAHLGTADPVSLRNR